MRTSNVKMWIPEAPSERGASSNTLAALALATGWLSSLMTLLEKRVFVPVHNPHLYRVLNRYKASGTNVVEHFYRARCPVQPCEPSFPSLFFSFFFLLSSHFISSHFIQIHSQIL
jgi:hypothetical protein